MFGADEFVAEDGEREGVAAAEEAVEGAADAVLYEAARR